MSAQHTHGQLRVTHNNWEASTLHCDGIAVARVLIESDVDEQTQQHCESVKEANARRLAACWNACDGISTERLERHGLPDFAQKISDLMAQRDELLEALQSLISDNHPECIPSKLWQKARAAIAKAIG